jgi:malate synthase
MVIRTPINPSLADENVVVTRPVSPDQAEILSPDALRFVAELVRRFGHTRDELMKLRDIRQREIDAGNFPGFLRETEHIRKSHWQVSPTPADLRERRVELTGPVDRRTIVNGLNSGADIFVADIEDSCSPTWYNCVQGQVNLRDAARSDIGYTGPDGRYHGLKARPATIIVRPRGWHMDEKHFRVDDEVVPAALFDFGLYFFHNAAAMHRRRTGPYFYLPKLESHLEARLWNDVFVHAQDALGLPRGATRATVLIETVLAAFEMDEILYELREHSAGLNFGRWDYVFSFAKRFRNHADFALPNLRSLTMERHFLSACSDLLVQTSHRRGVHALGGLATHVPVKDDPMASAMALKAVHEDKLREAGAGHDGSWVAHPGLVPLARSAFDASFKAPNQIGRRRDDVVVGEADLLTAPLGDITESGLRENLYMGIRYLEAWLRGRGYIVLNHVLVDAATAEIARAQVWQWLRHGAELEDGTIIDRRLVSQIMSEEMMQIRERVRGDDWDNGRFDLAAKLFARAITSEEFIEFLPAFAYDYLD